MNQKIIIIFTSILPPQIGGPATFCSKLINEVIYDKENILYVCSTSSSFNYRKIIKANKENKYITLGEDSNPLGRIFKIIKIAFKLRKKEFVVFSNTLDMEAFIFSLITRSHHIIKVVGDLAWERYKDKGGELNFDEYNKKFVNLTNFARKTYRNLPLLFAKKIILPSIFLHGYVKKIFPINKKNLTILYNSVDYQKANKETYSLAKKKFTFISDNYFCIVGRLSKYKRVFSIIKAFSYITEETNYKLLIIGDGPENKNLRTCVEKLNLKNKVIFTGKLESKFVKVLIKKSKALINFAEYEGLSHTILECMSTGNPFIASYICGNKELIDSYEGGYSVSNINDIKRAMLKIIKLNKSKKQKRYSIVKNKLNFLKEEELFKRYLEIIYRYQ